ncbi:hypothetical protein [Lucifera butyrica]|nr:hypothetical protein [Lucifera butyrica]
MNTSANSAAHAASTPGNTVSPEKSAVGKEIEGVTKAFQGTATQPPYGNKQSPTARTQNQMPANTQTPPVVSPNTQERTSTTTAVPVNHQVPDNKVPYSGYLWFMVVVVAVAAVMLGIRLYRNSQKRPRATDNFGKNNILDDEPDADVVQQSAAPKVKSNFEIRV